MHADNFYDLVVYKKAFALQQRIFELTKIFPKEELYSLTDQIRRSSRSVGANIAEAWRKRSYPAHFCSKLSDSDSELSETLHWLFTAHHCNFLPEPLLIELKRALDEVGALLGSMIHSFDKWCPKEHKFGKS